MPGWQQWEGGGGTVECGGVGSEGGVSARGHLAGMRGYLGNELIRWGGSVASDFGPVSSGVPLCAHLLWWWACASKSAVSVVSVERELVVEAGGSFWTGWMEWILLQLQQGGVGSVGARGAGWAHCARKN